MPTVAEILKASGLSDEQIAAIDAKVVTGLQTVLSTSEQAAESARQLNEKAELALRAQQQQYDQTIAPALDKWGNEAALKDAEVAFYRAQAEAAKANGFIPHDAPGYKPPSEPVRQPNGQFVAGGGGVPGSPVYATQAQMLQGISNANWLTSEHIRLYGTPPPDEILSVANEADAQRLDFKVYATKKYGFDTKKAEITAAAKAKEREAIVRETEERVTREMAEKFGNNPNVRSVAPSQFSELRKGVDSKQQKDPLSQSKQERHATTQTLIQRELVENANSPRVN